MVLKNGNLKSTFTALKLHFNVIKLSFLSLVLNLLKIFKNCLAEVRINKYVILDQNYIKLTYFQSLNTGFKLFCFF